MAWDGPKWGVISFKGSEYPASFFLCLKALIQSYQYVPTHTIQRNSNRSTVQKQLVKLSGLKGRSSDQADTVKSMDRNPKKGCAAASTFQT